MKIDFWRALGVGAGSILLWSLIGIFVYTPAVSLQTADYIMLAISALLLAGFSYLYFDGSSVRPSAVTGFWLAAAMFIYNFIYGFITGFAMAAQGLPPVLPPPTVISMVLGVMIGLGTPTFVGWYMGRTK